MMYSVILLPLLLSFSLTCAQNDVFEERQNEKTVVNKMVANRTSTERNLIKSLLINYHRVGKLGRPVLSANKTMRIRLGLGLIQIMDLEENNQILKTNCWVRYNWTDNLLKWNPADHRGISSIRLRSGQVWTPDIELYNFADDNIRVMKEARIVVSYNGEVVWIPQAIFRTSCEISIRYFPFDVQFCKMIFGSITMDTSQVELSWWFKKNEKKKGSREFPYIDMAHYFRSNEWVTDGENEAELDADEERVEQIKAVKTEHNLRLYDFGEDYRKFSVLEYRLKLSRNPNLYMQIIVVPLVLLAVMTTIIFWLPPDATAKTMLLILTLLAEVTPSAVRSFPLIGVFCCLSMFMSSLSGFLAAYVIKLHASAEFRRRLPPWLRWLFVYKLGSILLLTHNMPDAASLKTQSSVTDLDQEESFLCRTNLKSNGTLPSRSESMAMKETTERLLPGRIATVYGSPVRQQTSKSSGSLTPIQAFESDEEQESQSVQSSLSSRLGLLEQEVKLIKEHLTRYAKDQNIKHYRNIVAIEWRTFALVLDRIFLCLYVVAIVISMAAFIPHRSNSTLLLSRSSPNITHHVWQNHK